MTTPSTQSTQSTQSRRVLVLNGPNLGRLGTREPHIYGDTSYADLEALCIGGGSELGLDVEVRQTEAEAELLSWLHEAADRGVPVVLNAGALTHTSVALADACAMRTAPLVEVHISNVHQREQFRHHSYVSANASGVIVGLGVEGYVLALSWIAARLDRAAAQVGDNPDTQG
jgi:3-dehydroquinate dehydratase-2